MNSIKSFYVNYFDDELRATEAYVGCIMFRSKWLKNIYDVDSLDGFAIKNENKVIDYFFISNKNVDFIGDYIKDIFSSSKIVTFGFSGEYVKGYDVKVKDLFAVYPKAFSIMVCFCKCDLLTTFKELLSEYVEEFIFGKYTAKLYSNLFNMDYFWKSRVLAWSANSSHLMVDIDVISDTDNKSDSECLDVTKVLVDWLNKYEIVDYVAYACKTPSNGIHVILKNSKNLSKILFSVKDEHFNYFSKYGLDFELKVKQSVLTHIPSYLTDNSSDITYVIKNKGEMCHEKL